MQPKRTRNSTLSMRLTSAQRDSIRAAAQRQNLSVNRFVLEASLAAADRELADERHWVLPAVEFDWLCRLMDAPPVDLPNLRAELAKTPPWES